MVCKTLQRKPMLEGALKEMAPFEAATTDVAHAERLLLCYDLMYGKGLPRPGVHGAVAREASEFRARTRIADALAKRDTSRATNRVAEAAKVARVLCVRRCDEVGAERVS